MSAPVKKNSRMVGLLWIAASVLACQAQTPPLQKSPPKPTVSAVVPAPTAPEPSTIRIEPIAPLHIAAEKVPSWSYWVPILGGVISGLLTLGGAWLGLHIAQRNTSLTTEVAQQTSTAAIWQKANETELRDIQDKLDKFY